MQRTVTRFAAREKQRVAKAILARDPRYLVLTIERGLAVIRTARVTSGLLILDSDPRAIAPDSLVNFKDELAPITEDQILELESLINHPKACEPEFQRFFEHHPDFLRRWEFSNVHPQVQLSGAPALITDFILTDPIRQKAAILELKRPGARIIRRQKNRLRFANPVAEGSAPKLM